MHIAYVDHSGDEDLFVSAALLIPADQWRECFDAVVAFRRRLKESDGVFMRAEFHAWRFVAGRGRIADRVVTKGRRCDIFRETLGVTAALPGARLITASLPRKRADWAFERLANRLNRTMQAAESHAILMCDEGKEAHYTRLIRRLGVFNPIPSRYGAWETGLATKNIPTERIIEDPVFKKSDRSYFIQLADCAAYSLLRQDRPLESKTRYGLDTAFSILEPIWVLEANQRDPQGVIRLDTS